METCRVSNFCFHLKRTVLFLIYRHLCFRELMKLIRTQGRILQSALPQETVTANVTRRLLKIIREEFDVLQAKVSAII